MATIHAPLFIGGEELEAGREGTATTYDPATGKEFATYAVGGIEDVDQAVAAARDAFDSGPWRRLKPFERGRILHRIGEGLLARREEIARNLVLDSGKPLRDAYWEVDCSARFFEFYAGACDKLQGTSVPLGPGVMDWTIREPIGVSAQIVPWNYPLQVAVRGVAPALATGCTVVIKPASETPLALRELAQICREVGLPKGVLNIVAGSGSVVGDRLARHPGVDQVTFTGSVQVGRRVSEAAAVNAVPANMELGGKSPQLLFADADLDTSLPIVHSGMYLHAGQVCNAGTRLLVERSRHDEVVERLHRMNTAMTLGRGLDDPDMGPVVSAGQKRTVEEYMAIARSEGQLLEGAELPGDSSLSDGYFVRPSLVVAAGATARVTQEEIFGPVLSVVPFDTAEEGITIANDSEFGLVAGVHTTNISTAMLAAQELAAGQVWINSFGVGLDVEFPFSGYKRSGFGREKGLEALDGYQQVKNVAVAF
ncbi:aldehyde dehydrogenase family protein [Pseudactinotalea sp. HY158]|uniref:aldehyde dehydrogenase family protein n=1 Tax=Pseudactinotalea sp. HY158 TaxID=2654547 RepID=UPI00129CB954|nr:aldehyde dehydrogenase family protein [Pseudactinotalea sp. HY158]QGH70704.1 aldehyde dehydrogenase family protein [Pseudactinotalea sp. HY158]